MSQVLQVKELAGCCSINTLCEEDGTTRVHPHQNATQLFLALLLQLLLLMLLQQYNRNQSHIFAPIDRRTTEATVAPTTFQHFKPKRKRCHIIIVTRNSIWAENGAAATRQQHWDQICKKISSNSPSPLWRGIVGSGKVLMPLPGMPRGASSHWAPPRTIYLFIMDRPAQRISRRQVEWCV